MLNKKRNAVIVVILIAMVVVFQLVTFASNSEGNSLDFKLGQKLKEFLNISQMASGGNVIAYINELPICKQDLINVSNEYNLANDIDENMYFVESSWNILLSKKYVEVYAIENNIQCTSEELNELINSTKEAYNQDAAFRSYIAGTGMSIDNYLKATEKQYKEFIVRGKVYKDISEKLNLPLTSLEPINDYLINNYELTILDNDFIEHYK